jgi:hypothetical protein
VTEGEFLAKVQIALAAIKKIVDEVTAEGGRLDEDTRETDDAYSYLWTIDEAVEEAQGQWWHPVAE